MFNMVFKGRKNHVVSFLFVRFYEKQASAGCLRVFKVILLRQRAKILPLLKDDQQQREDLKVRIGAWRDLW